MASELQNVLSVFGFLIGLVLDLYALNQIVNSHHQSDNDRNAVKLLFIGTILMVSILVANTMPIGDPPNIQAGQMAREFKNLSASIAGKSLKEHEKEFYREYLSATMPAKISSICGNEECIQYERLLEKLQQKSDNIQLHFKGIEPFVLRKRFIDGKTPLAGPVIESPGKEPDEEPQKVTASKPVLDQGVEKDESNTRPILPSSNVDSSDSKQAETDHSIPNISNTRNPLREYLDQVGWVQCRKCGKVHYMTYGVFANFETRRCEQCGFDMHFHGFSQKIAAEAKQIENSMKLR